MIQSSKTRKLINAISSIFSCPHKDIEMKCRNQLKIDVESNFRFLFCPVEVNSRDRDICSVYSDGYSIVLTGMKPGKVRVTVRSSMERSKRLNLFVSVIPKDNENIETASTSIIHAI